MKIQIRARGIKLTARQRTQLEHQLAFALARFGERIGRVIVRLADAREPPGFSCRLEIVLTPQLVSVEHSDLTVALAVDHAAGRALRSVRRAIEKESWAVPR